MSRSKSSLSFIWDSPDKTKQNGVIISYTACVSRSEDGRCFQTFITSETRWLVGNLNASTKYYVRVLASTKAGHGDYSESKGFFTNGRKYDTVFYSYTGRIKKQFDNFEIAPNFTKWMLASRYANDSRRVLFDIL